jgi:hypothetical protein
MKLTIKNYKKIIGIYGNHAIVNAVETSDYYTFTVKDVDEVKCNDVFIKRDGRIDNDGDWIYHFGRGSHNTQCVTADWFAIMPNAIDTILNEYETV